MWTLIIIGLVIGGLVAYVWRQQVRHREGPGVKRDNLLSEKGSHWGNSGVGGPG